MAGCWGGGAEERLEIHFTDLAIAELDTQPVGTYMLGGLHLDGFFYDGNLGNRRVMVTGVMLRCNTK